MDVVLTMTVLAVALTDNGYMVMLTMDMRTMDILTKPYCMAVADYRVLLTMALLTMAVLTAWLC